MAKLIAANKPISFFFALKISLLISFLSDHGIIKTCVLFYSYMEKTCDVAGMAILAKKIGGKSA